MNSDKVILDLCGGTGSWSKPYKDAGCRCSVERVSVPKNCGALRRLDLLVRSLRQIDDYDVAGLERRRAIVGRCGITAANRMERKHLLHAGRSQESVALDTGRPAVSHLGTQEEDT